MQDGEPTTRGMSGYRTSTLAAGEPPGRFHGGYSTIAIIIATHDDRLPTKSELWFSSGTGRKYSIPQAANYMYLRGPPNRRDPASAPSPIRSADQQYILYST